MVAAAAPPPCGGRPLRQCVSGSSEKRESLADSLSLSEDVERRS